MDFSKKSAATVTNLAVLFLLVAGVISIALWSSFFSDKPLFSFQAFQCSRPNTTVAAVEKVDELDAALRRAATTPNGTVIIAVVNRAYVERSDGVLGPTMLDLFVESLWLGEGTRGLLDNLLIVAVDRTAHERCVFRRLNCYRLDTDGVDFGGEKLYMSQDFIRMMWRRTLFLLDVLRRGYSFIFTDTDIMWLRNPFVRLSHNGTADLQISTDEFYGDPRSESNLINTGFYFVQSNNRTISLFELWHASRNEYPDKKEQDVLVELMHKGVFREMGLNVRFLDTHYFSGFCQDSRDIRAVTTVHANCCRSISAKIVDLSAVLREWKRFGRGRGGTMAARNGSEAMANDGRAVQAVPWSHLHRACVDSWKTISNHNLNASSVNRTLG